MPPSTRPKRQGETVWQSARRGEHLPRIPGSRQRPIAHRPAFPSLCLGTLRVLPIRPGRAKHSVGGHLRHRQRYAESSMRSRLARSVSSLLCSAPADRAPVAACRHFVVPGYGRFVPGLENLLLKRAFAYVAQSLLGRHGVREIHGGNFSLTGWIFLCWRMARCGCRAGCTDHSRSSIQLLGCWQFITLIALSVMLLARYLFSRPFWCSN